MQFDDWINTLPSAQGASPEAIALMRTGWIAAKMDTLVDSMAVPLTDEELGRVRSAAPRA